MNTNNQTIHTISINDNSKENKIPRNEANPLPPFKLLIHTGNIWPTNITDADKKIKSAFIILQIVTAI